MMNQFEILEIMRKNCIQRNYSLIYFILFVNNHILFVNILFYV